MANTWNQVVQEAKDEMQEEARKLGGLTSASADGLAYELADSNTPNSVRDRAQIIASEPRLADYALSGVRGDVAEAMRQAIVFPLIEELRAYGAELRLMNFDEEGEA